MGSDEWIELTVVVVLAADSSENADTVTIADLALRETLLSRLLSREGDGEAHEEDRGGENGGELHSGGAKLMCVGGKRFRRHWKECMSE